MSDIEKQDPASNGVGSTDCSTVCGFRVLLTTDDFWAWVESEWRNTPQHPYAYPILARRDLDSEGVEWPFYLDLEEVTQMRAALLSNDKDQRRPAEDSQ